MSQPQPVPEKTRKRRRPGCFGWIGIAVGVVVLLFVIIGVTGGWDSDDDADDTAAPAGCASSVPLPEPYASAVAAGPLRDGSTLAGGQAVPSTERPGRDDLVVRLCEPGKSGDELRYAATAVARTIDRAGLGERVASLRVSNVASDAKAPDRVLTVEDFTRHVWTAGDDVLRAAWQATAAG